MIARLNEMMAVFAEVLVPEEIMDGIYHIYAKREIGKRFGDEYYIIFDDYCGDVISKRALSFGQKEKNMYTFDANEIGKIIDYEMKLYQCKAKNSMQDSLWEELYFMVVYGKVDYPEYFGEVVPLVMTPKGPMTRYLTVTNGLFFVEGGGEWMLCLSPPMTSFLTIPASEGGISIVSDPGYGEGDGGKYVFYDKDLCAPIIYEMLKYKDDDGVGKLEKYITSKEALWANVCNCEWYVNVYNKFSERQCARIGEEIKESKRDQEEGEKLIEKLKSEKLCFAGLPPEEFLILPEN